MLQITVIGINRLLSSRLASTIAQTWAVCLASREGKQKGGREVQEVIHSEHKILPRAVEDVYPSVRKMLEYLAS